MEHIIKTLKKVTAASDGFLGTIRTYDAEGLNGVIDLWRGVISGLNPESATDPEDKRLLKQLKDNFQSCLKVHDALETLLKKYRKDL